MVPSSPIFHILSKSLYQIRNENQQLRQQMCGVLFSYIQQSRQKDELFEKDAFYRNLVEQFYEGIVVVIQQKIVYVNQAGAKLLGAANPGQIIGQPIGLFEMSDSHNRVVDSVMAESGIEGWQNYFSKFSRLDGSSFSSEVILVPVIYQNQKADQLIIKNNVLLQESEDALKQIKSLVEVLVDYLPGPFYIIDEELNFVRWNKDYERETGYSTDEIAGFNFFEIIPEEDRKKQLQRMNEILVNGESFTSELNILTRDGRRIPFLVTCSRIRAVGKVYLIGMAIKISEQKEAEKALRASENRIRAILDSINEAFFIHDGDTGRILGVNRRMCEMYGYSAEEARQATIETLSSGQPPYSQLDALNWIRKAKEEGPQLFEWQSKDKSGRMFWVEINMRFANIEGFDRLLVAARDINERKRSEAEIQRLNQNLAVLVEERTRELEVLYNVTTIAVEAQSVQPFLDKVLDWVMEALNCHSCMIHLMDGMELPREGKIPQLQLMAHKNLSQKLSENFSSISAGQKITHWIIQNNEPLVIPDLGRDERGFKQILPAEIQSYIGTPVRAHGRILGVLGTFRPIEQEVSTDEVSLLSTVADLVGVAIENLHLRQQAESSAILEERQRLARDLHDSVTQSLYTLNLFAEASYRLFESGNQDQLKMYMANISSMARQALGEMRLLVHELRPLELEKEGLIGALHKRISAVEKRSNIQAQVILEGMDLDLRTENDNWPRMPREMEDSLYRIAQEALNNSLKHAQATQVKIYLRSAEDYVELEIEDNGVGFVVDDAHQEGGLGLLNMQERTEKFGGSLTILSSPGAGCRIIVKMPLVEYMRK